MNRSRRKFLQLAAMAGVVGLTASYPVFIERYLVMTNHYRVPVPNLPPAFNGFTIAQLTDLHHGTLVPRGFIEYIVTRTNRLGADMIVCTGDYVHGRNSSKEIDSVWPVLANLSAPYGVFSVLGNHDHWADTNRSLYWLNRTGQNLRAGLQEIAKDDQRIWLAGAGDLWEDNFQLNGLLGNIPEEDCRIVLAHNPDTADIDNNGRVDLFVAGHTHGGQISIPYIGPPVLPVQNKNYASGLVYSQKQERVFISRGIGWAIYPVRLNCFPEIAVLHLVPA